MPAPNTPLPGPRKGAAPPPLAPSIPELLIVTDMNQKVKHVNSHFVNYTGFEASEVVGRKCNFLQGEQTDPEDLVDLRLAVESRRETTVVVLNYTKNKKPFWNVLRIHPVFDSQPGAEPVVTMFVGHIFTLPIPDYVLAQGVHPRLCLDDALALIRVVSSIPKQIASASTKVLVENPDSDDDDLGRLRTPSKPSSPSSVSSLSSPQSNQGVILQRHVNYAQRFSLLDDSPLRSGSPGFPPLARTTSPAVSAPHFEFIAETLLPTEMGRFRVRAYRDAESGAEPLALIVGEVEGASRVLCRVHDQCQTSEVFHSLRCDCKQQLEHAMGEIQAHGGIILYLPQEGRGIGIANKIAAYAAQELGMDTVDANRHLGLPDDAREYSAVKQILADLRVSSIRLLTNNPRKLAELTALGVVIDERVECITPPNSSFSAAYQKAKADRMGHMF